MLGNTVEILLVEDNPSDLELAMRALRENKLCNNIQVARDGEEALDFIFCRGSFAGKRVDELPRVILLDLNLPLIDGLEVLRQVRADPRTRHIPVVVLTSSTQEHDLMESYCLGINSYITKPVDFDQFKDAMRAIGMYWLLLNRPPPPPRGDHGKFFLPCKSRFRYERDRLHRPECTTRPVRFLYLAPQLRPQHRKAENLPGVRPGQKRQHA